MLNCNKNHPLQKFCHCLSDYLQLSSVINYSRLHTSYVQEWGRKTALIADLQLINDPRFVTQYVFDF